MGQWHAWETKETLIAEYTLINRAMSSPALQKRKGAGP